MQSDELAAIVARSLAKANSTVMFGVPGGGRNLDIVGAAESSGIRFVLTHTEAAAAYMAAATAELQSNVCSCLVTRGPGAASAVNGVAHAWLDRQPVLLLADTVSDADSGRISHQRIDQQAMYASITKWSGPLSGSNAHQVSDEAVKVALAPRPGPVGLNLDPQSIQRPQLPAKTAQGGAGEISESSLSRLSSLIEGADRIALVVGMGARPYSAAVRNLAMGTNIPVLQTYKAKGVIPDSWPNAVGVLTGATLEAPVLKAADLIVMLGVDSVELIPNSWPYAAKIASLAEWPEDSRYFTPDIAMVGPLPALISLLPKPLPDNWPADYARRCREAIRAELAMAVADEQGLGPVDLVDSLRGVASPGSVATVDAGAHMLAAMLLWDVDEPGEILISSGLATMGFALPAAISAAISRPGRRVYCFVGDGGIGMVLAELETLARLELPVTVVVFNDNGLSLIRLKQKLVGHGGSGAVSYHPTDFAAIARGFGITGITVTNRETLLNAVASCQRATDPPLLIDARVDPSSYAHVMRITRG